MKLGGNHQLQRKTEHPCAKPKYRSAAHDSVFQSFFEGTDAHFSQIKGVFPFYTIAWKGSLQKDVGKKKRQSFLLIKDNI